MQISILSYNIWFKEHDIKNRLASLLTEIMIHSPDVICLQEVREDIWPKILDYLGAAYPFYYPVEIHQYGVATLSRYPIIEQMTLPFPGSRMGRLLSLCKIQYQEPKRIHEKEEESEQFHDVAEPVFEVTLGEGENDTTMEVHRYKEYHLLIANAHFESEFQTNKPNKEKLSQYQQSSVLMDLYQESIPEMILCCDSNLLATEEEYFFPKGNWKDAWKIKGNQEEQYTYDTATNPYLKTLNRTIRSRLDRIIFRGQLENLNYRRLTGPDGNVQPSDHYGVMAVFRIADS